MIQTVMLTCVLISFLCLEFWEYKRFSAEMEKLNDNDEVLCEEVKAFIGLHRKDMEAIQAQAKRWNRRAMVKKWLKKMNLPCAPVGTLNTISPFVLSDRIADRFYKLQEEFKELRSARDRKDITAFIDAVVDITYVCETTAWYLGFDMNKAFLEVHKSNMTKDRALFWEDGKGKGLNFVEPDFSRAIGKRRDRS